MKKLLKGMLILALVCSSVKAATNKTYFAERPIGVNMAMEYTAWNEMIHMDLEGTDRHGGYFSITPFYQDSTNGDNDLGRYFGVANKYNFAASSGAAATRDVNIDYIIHDTVQAGLSETLVDVKLDPEWTAFGVRFDFYKDFSGIIKGLYFKANVPLVNIETDMKLNVSARSDANVAASATNARTRLISVLNGTWGTNMDSTSVIVGAGAHASGQDTLKYAKINGNKDTTMFGDIDVMLGWRFLDKNNYYLAINLGMAIPTGNAPTGEWVFEPVVGNGNHWSFGAGLDFAWTMWDDEDQNLKLAAALNYRYLLEGTERRTLGLRNNNGLLPWGQYYLVGEINTVRAPAAKRWLFPAANVLTQRVNVKPDSQLDAILQLSYNNGGFTIDLGYNFFWKDNEDVELKETWVNNKYGVGCRTQITSVATAIAATFTVVNGTDASVAAGVTGGALANINTTVNTTANTTFAWAIDKSVCETPSQMTHKIYGGVGYIFRDWEYPVMLNLAGHYEFASDDGIENWGIWGKVAIGF